MDKTRTAAESRYTQGSTTITVHHVFGEKATLAELIQGYISEQATAKLSIASTQPVYHPDCNGSAVAAVREETGS